MKIAILSDIHDNLPNLDKCLSWCGKNKIKTIICCGDVCNKETVTSLNDCFEGDIYLVRGNADIYEKEILFSLKHIKDCARVGRVEFDGINIGICHEPYLFDAVLNKGECDIIFYGHTHKPWEEKKRGVRCINPGTLSGMFSLGTFAVFDTSSGEMDLKIVERL